ncbi:actin family [Myxozyma melibiosi]|uniref:Actin family n=1 Tax=Myxozyma melibiosi TaxID=54550 RepID=A0ABR1FE60_9ASCO
MAPQPQPTSVFVLDNGASEIKAGLASSPSPTIYPNAITRSRDRRVFIADELYTQCKDFSGLVYRRPYEKGHLTNWESEKVIWDRVIYGDGSSSSDGVRPEETAFILGEPSAQLPVCSANTDQIVFEEYGFATYFRCPSAFLVHENDHNEALYQTEEETDAQPLAESTKKNTKLLKSDTTLVIDSGYSATVVTPIIENKVYHAGIKRLNIGGKLLRNYLKETISYRHYNMMDESYIVNEIKEHCCYVSTKFAADLEICKKFSLAKNPLAIEYVLPRASASGFRAGHVRTKSEASEPDDQILVLANERFSIPEVLFHPSDIDIAQAGVPEIIAQSLNTIPDRDVRNLLLANTVFVGGSTKFEGFKERVSSELQALTPDDAFLRLGFPDDPITYAWQGGARLGQQKARLRSLQVTKKEYMEYGSNICLQKFGRPAKDDREL